ncbi:enzyme E2 S [Seminavis robusta]|uniref:E2 ubiquitin-conjugating enzyme n=1 Tax=Seminavis robusta TaxID=568900 RepID=A0A9N8ECH4_9STRA|nr:enzyme E2 S [Seminavis robusta]|eukprot:Sro803_g204760.1 enzyme E2 S (259) ;mRNA; r:21716-22641
MSSTTTYRPYNRSSSGTCSENLPPRTLARVAREIRDLHKNPPEGVRLVVDAQSGVPSSLGEVVAEIQGPQDTPYEGKFFQLKLVLSCDFPSSPPRGFFLTKIYHPNVDMSTGAICVNTLKKDWTPETTFSHVLSVIRCLLIIPFPESSLNDEAGKLFMDSYDEYSKRARLMADVHGRPFQTGKTEEDGKPMGTNNSNKGTDGTTSVLSDASVSKSNPLRSNNGATTGGSGKSGSGNVRKQVSNGKSGKMTKKKSLKRL